jgi:hypothetical protein
MEKIYENDSGVVYYDRDKKILVDEFFGRADIGNGLEIFVFEQNFANNNTISGICTDIRKLSGVFLQLNEYFEKEFFPYMIQKGLICNAIVVSRDVFTKFATKDLLKRIKNFEIRTFDEREDAMRWVEEKVSGERSKEQGILANRD